ncbi:MAG: hypothetical protein ABIZ70_06060 [Gemmatimonadales bacterium]
MITLGDVAIMGGGCYGTFYLNQLERARDKGAVDYRRVIVVDRDPASKAAQLPEAPQRELALLDWNAFLDQWLRPELRDRDGRTDTIVPTPLMPHLLADWLERRARERWSDRVVERRRPSLPMGTPYDQLHTDGVRYVSHADWLCPVHCIEPAVCPAIKGPRTWEMGDTVQAWSDVLRTDHPTAQTPALFTCRHAVYGVGMYPARNAFDGLQSLATVADTPTGGDLVIGSISACHGAVAVLRVGPHLI